MNYVKKIIFTVLLFVVQSNYANTFITNNEPKYSISENDNEKSFSDDSFYNNYESNWKHKESFNTSSYWNQKESSTEFTSSASLTGKEMFYAANGVASKTKSKVSINFNQSKSSSSSSDVCSIETALTITQSNSNLGNARSTLNNSGVPSFCLNYYSGAPSNGNEYHTTLSPNTDISFGNNNYTDAEIRELVKRTVSVITHSPYAPTNLPSNLNNNFYKAIQTTIWKWTNNLSFNKFKWTGSDGHEYDSEDLMDWVTDGDLSAANVFWLVPDDNSKQPEVLLNQTSRPAPVTTSITICSNDSYVWSVNGTTYYGSNGNVSVTEEGNSVLTSQGVTCGANQTLNITVTQANNASNTTSSSTITESDTKTLVGSPSGGTWAIISGGGSISGSTYTPDNINSNTNVTIRYTIAANGPCTETTDDVTFTVTAISDPCTVGATVGVVTANDPDADGINNICDLDDDNDGILDTDEGCSETTTIYEENFGTGATRSSDSNVVNHSYKSSGAIGDGWYAVVSSLTPGLKQYNEQIKIVM